MKRFATILLAFVLLISGMHFSVATHFCGGKVAAVKISLSGIKAGCGMVSDASSAPSRKPQVSTRCCFDELTVYKVESHYAPSAFDSKIVTANKIHAVSLVQVGLPNNIFSVHAELADHRPPEPFAVNAVNPAEICVFRI
jgi:hypothetical protein